MKVKDFIKRSIRALKRKEYAPITKMAFDYDLLSGQTVLITRGSGGLGSMLVSPIGDMVVGTTVYVTGGAGTTTLH